MNEISTLVRSVTYSFNFVAEKAVGILVSVIFSDIERLLLDFDTLWYDNTTSSGSSTNNVTKTIANTLTDYFKDIRSIMEPHYYKSVLLVAAKSCVLRFLLFLKYKPNAFTGDTFLFLFLLFFLFFLLIYRTQKCYWFIYIYIYLFKKINIIIYCRERSYEISIGYWPTENLFHKCLGFK